MIYELLAKHALVICWLIYLILGSINSTNAFNHNVLLEKCPTIGIKRCTLSHIHSVLDGITIISFLVLTFIEIIISYHHQFHIRNAPDLEETQSL